MHSVLSEINQDPIPKCLWAIFTKWNFFLNKEIKYQLSVSVKLLPIQHPWLKCYKRLTEIQAPVMASHVLLLQSELQLNWQFSP